MGNEVIKVVELLNGEKLVGTVIPKYAGDQDYIRIKNPVVIAPQKQDEEGNVTFALIAWPLFKDANDESFTIYESAIVTSYEPNGQVLAHYNRVMAQKSGLILPPSIKTSTTQLLQE